MSSEEELRNLQKQIRAEVNSFVAVVAEVRKDLRLTREEAEDRRLAGIDLHVVNTKLDDIKDGQAKDRQRGEQWQKAQEDRWNAHENKDHERFEKVGQRFELVSERMDRFSEQQTEILGLVNDLKRRINDIKRASASAIEMSEKALTDSQILRQDQILAEAERVKKDAEDKAKAAQEEAILARKQFNSLVSQLATRDSKHSTKPPTSKNGDTAKLVGLVTGQLAAYGAAIAASWQYVKPLIKVVFHLP